MSRFWLIYYAPKDRRLHALIVDSWSLPQGRLHAALEGLDKGLRYYSGYQLDAESAALISPRAIGRMLSPDEATKIIRRIERGIPKRVAATSVKRNGSVRTRAKR